ncbi:MAG: DTW domain-containing protein [Burkholderiaceae bacterium]|nr:DTW domain-containing protein [Burkholderiaceae bacterium]
MRCSGCGLLATQCVCSALSVIDNSTPVRILQHPDETTHPLNTARWIALGLVDARVTARESFKSSDWDVAGHTPLLLYPDEPGVPARPRPPGPYVLVTLDGTWRHAAATLRTHPALRTMHRMALPAPSSTHAASNYRLRKSSRADSYSTVEAVAAALDVLDSPRSHHLLLQPFTLQIERQIAFLRKKMGVAEFQKNYPRIPDESRRDTPS